MLGTGHVIESNAGKEREREREGGREGGREGEREKGAHACMFSICVCVCEPGLHAHSLHSSFGSVGKGLFVHLYFVCVPALSCM